MPKYRNVTKSISFDPKRREEIGPRSVLQPIHTIPIKINRYFTDVNGVILDKNTVPLALQTRYPVFVLGQFDLSGGFAIGRKIIAPDAATILYDAFINGMGNTTQSITGISGINEIQDRVTPGDLVIVYTDDRNSPNYFIWIVVKNTAGSYASILSNSMSTQNDMRLGDLFVYEIMVRPDVERQLTQDLHFTRFDNIGNFNDNQLQPLGIYRSIMDFQNTLVRVKTTFKITQFLGINFYLLFECDNLILDMKITKIN